LSLRASFLCAGALASTLLFAWAVRLRKGPGAEPISAGERIYREGKLISGEPLEAVVEGDVTLSGAQFSCVVCHGRSGMGSVEGARLAPPVTPVYLGAPRKLKSRPRPPYTDAALARAIREGIDAGGNRLDRLMPRYKIGDADMAALLKYLRTLSATPSPGATMDEIHFATVVAPGAAPAARETMLGVIDRFFRAKNGTSQDRRARHIASWGDYYGRWVLHVWELEGPPETWKQQLKSRYREQPVFALVSGLGGEEWGPVHSFCEAQRIPCLLPNVETPPETGDDYYSLYFSRGSVLEAQAIAAHLLGLPAPQNVLQVFRAGGNGERPALALATALGTAKGAAAANLTLSNSGSLPSEQLLDRATEQKATAVVLWLKREEVASLHLDGLAKVRVYLSSTLLGDDFTLPTMVASNVFVAHPYALPAEAARRFPRVSGWVTGQGLPPVSGPERRIADQTLFTMMLLNEGVMHVNKNLYRDYMLEVMDHFSGFDTWSSLYPRLSFGPGQRYLSKGCHIVSLDGTGSTPEWQLP
jgi:mono/diheme cytochrome c family protein